MENMKEYSAEKYVKELEKTKTRGLTKFYFDDRKNKDFQEYEGKQYNPNYEFGGKVLKYENEKSLIEIRNRLVVGDTMEILIPNKLEGYEFTIENLWDSEAGESVEFVNPGKSGQTILMKLPIKCEDGWILRRKKSK